MASVPFAGRYRMVDFVLSGMANSGISNVSIVVRKNYHSLMDHLGTGREWDMARRLGGLNIVPPFAEKGVRVYSGRVEALASILNFLEHQKERYVVMCDAHIAANFDYNALLAKHRESGADVTVAYQKTEIPEGLRNDNYTLTIGEDGRVTELLINDYRPGVQNLDLNIYVLERETLIRLVKDATSRGLIYFERDILAHNVNILNIQAVEYTGYVAHICDMKSYFEENLKLIDEQNLDALFPKGKPVYTKVRDDNPTRYVDGSQVSNSLLADGCVIEGTVENCVLFRGVVVKKGAVVKNCVLMQDTVVEADVALDCVVTDKNVHITAGKKLSGTRSFPVYVQKNHIV
jgi:glucose-1-phosphate adenylyltransferase